MSAADKLAIEAAAEAAADARARADRASISLTRDIGFAMQRATNMGLDFERVARVVTLTGVDALQTQCGYTPETLAKLLEQFRE